MTTLRPRHAVARARSKAARPSQHSLATRPSIRAARGVTAHGAVGGGPLLHVRRLCGSRAYWRGQSCSADRARPNVASWLAITPLTVQARRFLFEARVHQPAEMQSAPSLVVPLLATPAAQGS